MGSQVGFKDLIILKNVFMFGLGWFYTCLYDLLTVMTFLYKKKMS